MPLIPVKPRSTPPPRVAQTAVQSFSMHAAPVHGLDASLPFTDQDPRTAQILKDAWCRRYGNELRKGYRRWLSNIPGEVRSVMSYMPPRGKGSATAPKLFAANNAGNIYDATTRQTEAFVPSVMQAVAGQIEPGRMSWTNFSTSATNYLCVVSAGAGYWTYDAAGGWVNRTASITGTSGANLNFDFVMVWKNRLWFIENNTNRAWYLPAGAVQGAAAAFDFGPLMVHGGDLRAMASWTIDAGDGLDDRLVLVGSNGDVLVYVGTDPSAAATFQLNGRWYIGQPPAGRRFMSEYGGDLAILCSTGIEYISHVVQGDSPKSIGLDTATAFHRYMDKIGQEVTLTKTSHGWGILLLTSEEAMIITTPYIQGNPTKQYALNTFGNSWNEITNNPMLCADIHDGILFFGTSDGQVNQAFTGGSDGEKFDGTAGTVITVDLQSAFIPPNDDRMALKRMVLCMPMFIAPAAPNFLARINTEWQSESSIGSPAAIVESVSLWDVALWDEGLWGEGLRTYAQWVGTENLGCYASLRLTFTGQPGTIFTSWKLVYEPGGIM